MSAEVDIKQLAIVRDETAVPKLRARRRHLVSRYVIPGVLLVGFLSLVAWASRDTLLPPQPVWVVPVLASQSAVQSAGTPLFQAAGWIEPRPTPIRVAALAPGVVEQLLVVEDQAVTAGEPIAELIKQDAKLAYDGAAANLKLREAEVAEAQASVDAARTRFEQPVHLEAALSEANAALAAVETELRNLPFATRRAEAQLRFAIADHQGKQASRGAVSGRSIQEAKSAHDMAQAQVEELRSRAESLAAQTDALTQRRNALQTQLKLLADEKHAKDGSEAKFQAANARLEQAKVALAEAKLRLDRMTVHAPIAGRVYQLIGYPGTTLTGGMGTVAGTDGSTVVTLYRPDRLQVRVDVRFADIPKVALGQPVTINNPALPHPITGNVLFISSEANIQKNTLEVKVAIDSPSDVLKPEMLVDATFLAPKPAESLSAESEETRLYVPRQLVLSDDAGSYLWIADQSAGVARKTLVTTGGAASGGLVEITSGVKIGARVIARGYENLTDGARITVVSEDAQTGEGGSSAAGRPDPLQRLPHEGE
jgi:HlyD family secretion protein